MLTALLLFLFILLNVADTYLTDQVIKGGGYEKNPILAKAMTFLGNAFVAIQTKWGLFPVYADLKRWGVVGAMVVGKLVAIIAIGFITAYLTDWVAILILVAICALYTWVVKNNYVLYKKLE